MVRSVIYRGQLKESCDILSRLCEAWRVCSLHEQLKQAWSVKAGYRLLFIKQVIVQGI